jgi:hypothetical protein
MVYGHLGGFLLKGLVTGGRRGIGEVNERGINDVNYNYSYLYNNKIIILQNHPGYKHGQCTFDLCIMIPTLFS